MASRKFKTGDKVEVIKGRLLGKTGTVKRYSPGYSSPYYVAGKYVVSIKGYGEKYLLSTELELASHKVDTTPKGKYSVDEDFIKEAHKEACSDWKKKIEKKFPEVFKSKMFNFGESVRYNTSCSSSNNPIKYIAHGVAPEGEEGQWLVVREGWKIVTKKTDDGRTFLGFEKI